MLESLAFALAKSLIVFMFDTHLENAQSVKIQGAPKWFAQQTVDHVCDSGFAKGGLESVDRSKLNAQLNMKTRIEKSIESVAYNSFRDRTAKDELELVQGFIKDSNLQTFINANLIYENIEYREKSSTAFTRACINKESMLKYQEERLIKLAKSLSLHRRDKSVKDLEAEVQQLQ